MSTEEWPIGTVRHIQQRLEGRRTCERCGQSVEIWSETDFWEIGSDGHRRYVSYGTACGECCGDVYGEDGVRELTETFRHFSKQESEL